MITVATCSNNAEAELLHSLLTNSGIQAFVLDDAFGGMIRIQVDEAQSEDAKKLLADAEQAADESDDEDENAGDDAR